MRVVAVAAQKAPARPNAPATTRFLRLGPAFAFLALTAACGQKGPLYLPGDPSEMQSIESTVESAMEEAVDEDQRDGDEPSEPE